MSTVSARSRGFTLLELLIATAIFMVVCGAMFGLLQVSQQKYAAETQMSGSFQEARLALDQIVRDINISGYPSLNMFSVPPSPQNYAIAPFAWDLASGYPTSDCFLNGTSPACATTPGNYQLAIETYVPTSSGNVVGLILYQISSSNVLLRGVVSPKPTDPATAFSTATMTPMVTNVMNIAKSVPLFSYSCSTYNGNGVPTGTQLCSTAGIYSAPRYISDVDITLIVQTPQADVRTQAPAVIELTGRGHRANSPN